MITGKDYKYTTWITFKDEKGQHLDANSSVKIIYSNLQNSSYNGIKIKKAVYTFSNFVFDPSFQTIDLGVYSNPHSGFAYIGIKDFRISIQYFADDEMKQPINFTKGTAYLVFASLNQDGGHNERARAVNGTPIELAGSSIKSHADGWLYADVPNSDATWLDPNTGKIVKGGWDNIGDGTYVGAGAAEISGTNPIVEFNDVWPEIP